MCGICGFVGFRDQDLLVKMTEALSHRGPDDVGTYADDEVSMGHRRLSIIDLSPAGRQPMANEDGTVQVAFNGEIYNHLELRPLLLDRGHRFRSRADTEVLVHGYEEWGPDLLQRIRGMFALAIWDAGRRSLLLARDPMGKKPLFYAVTRRGLLFASEPKSLYLDPGLDRGLDPASLRKYLLLGYVPAPRSMVRGVRKVRAGHYLLARGGEIAEREYWRLPVPDPDGPAPALGEAADRLDGLLARAVGRRLISDVPLGIFLSGGLDSSAVAALAARASTPRGTGGAGGQIRTFAIGFSERGYDESEYARQVARRLGSEHHEEVLTPDRLLEVVPRLAQILDEPLADASIIPTFLLSQMARRRVTVALGGDGADELFAGYPTYLAHRVADWYEVLPASLRDRAIRPLVEALPPRFENYSLDYLAKRFVAGAGHPVGVRHHLWMSYLLPADAARALGEGQGEGADPFEDIHTCLEGCPVRDPVEAALHLNLRLYLQDCILVKVDRASMATSLEVRSPYLDRDVVEYVAALPLRLKLRGTRGKVLLKALGARYLPPEIVRRKKHGFTVPVGQWFRGPLQPLLRDALSPGRIRRQGLFEADWLQRMVQEHLDGRRDRWRELWALLVFQLWWDRYGP